MLLELLLQLHQLAEFNRFNLRERPFEKTVFFLPSGDKQKIYNYIIYRYYGI